MNWPRATFVTVCQAVKTLILQLPIPVSWMGQVLFHQTMINTMIPYSPVLTSEANRVSADRLTGWEVAIGSPKASVVNTYLSQVPISPNGWI
jgi:hypothetical protein